MNDEKKGKQVDAGQPQAAPVIEMDGPVLVASFQNHIIIDFTECPDLEEYIRDKAADEFRSPESQVLWIIRQHKRMEAANA